jgi:hypothetical protein
MTANAIQPYYHHLLKIVFHAKRMMQTAGTLMAGKTVRLAKIMGGETGEKKEREIQERAIQTCRAVDSLSIMRGIHARVET